MKAPLLTNRRAIVLIALVGATIPASMLAQRYFELPGDGLFGFILPSLAAVTVVGLVVYLAVSGTRAE